MRIYKGIAYLEPGEVVSLTGLTHDQLDQLTKAGFIESHVTVETEPDKLRYTTNDAVALFHELQHENVPGIKGIPDIHNGDKRKRLIRQLNRQGISLVPSGNLVPPKPKTKPKAKTHKRLVKAKPEPPVEKEPEPMTVLHEPDHLPFPFMVGDPTPARGMTATDLKLVEGCFGYLDETNPECAKNCTFKNACAATRLKVLQALATELDTGKTPQEVDLSFVEQDYINLQDQLASLSFES